MKIYVNSLTWDYENDRTVSGEAERICTGTRIEAMVTYPATETTSSVNFHGIVRHKGRLCDINEAKKIVQGIIKNKK